MAIAGFIGTASKLCISALSTVGVFVSANSFHRLPDPWEDSRHGRQARPVQPGESLMKTLILALLGSALAPLAAEAAPMLHFCPAGGVWTYPFNAQRGLNSLVLQSAALVNQDASAFEAQSGEIDILSGGEVKESRRLSHDDLVKGAARGVRLAGLAQALPGVFCDGALYGPASMAPTPVVATGQALLVYQQTFALAGPRDGVRVIIRGTQDGKPVEVSAALPIRQGAAKTALHFPLKGAWTIGAGPSLQSHHRWAPFEEFAYDILRVDAGGQTHAGDGMKFSDYYAYGQPVLAAADGTVIDTHDGEAEDNGAMKQAGESDDAYLKRLMADQAARLAKGLPGVTGNRVIIDHGDGEFSIYVHLKPGSVRVKAGQKVTAGEQLAQVGSSGNSTEPHLHFQLCDTPKPLGCAGIPMRFVDTGEDLAMPQTGDVVTVK
jgi:murein DD-endopeptidase MepM/ murein hydrolase activator NlpD